MFGPKRAATNFICSMILARATMKKIYIKKFMILRVVYHVNSVRAGDGKQPNFELIHKLRAWQFLDLTINWILAWSLDPLAWRLEPSTIFEWVDRQGKQDKQQTRLHRDNWPYCELRSWLLIACCLGLPIDSCASDLQLCFLLIIQVFDLFLDFFKLLNSLNVKLER